jgi:tRNA(fMet)-specific endonuclease VapC
LFGVARLPDGARKRSLAEYLSSLKPWLTVLPYDQDAAEWHHVERTRLERIGDTAPFVDGQIAAVAAVHGLILITANTKDFARFHGLEVESWW